MFFLWYIGMRPAVDALTQTPGTKKRGADGKIWIVKNKDGINKWMLYDERPHILIKKLYSVWQCLARGDLLAIFTNGTYYVFKRTHDIWKNLYNNFAIEAIVWSDGNVNNLVDFVRFLVKNSSAKRIKKMLKSGDIYGELVKDYDFYFRKSRKHGKKDFSF